MTSTTVSGTAQVIFTPNAPVTNYHCRAEYFGLVTDDPQTADQSVTSIYGGATLSTIADVSPLPDRSGTPVADMHERIETPQTSLGYRTDSSGRVLMSDGSTSSIPNGSIIFGWGYYHEITANPVRQFPTNTGDATIGGTAQIGQTAVSVVPAIDADGHPYSTARILLPFAIESLTLDLDFGQGQPFSLIAVTPLTSSTPPFTVTLGSKGPGTATITLTAPTEAMTPLALQLTYDTSAMTASDFTWLKTADSIWGKAKAWDGKWTRIFETPFQYTVSYSFAPDAPNAHVDPGYSTSLDALIDYVVPAAEAQPTCTSPTYAGNVYSSC